MIIKDYLLQAVKKKKASFQYRHMLQYVYGIVLQDEVCPNKTQRFNPIKVYWLDDEVKVYFVLGEITCISRNNRYKFISEEAKQTLFNYLISFVRIINTEKIDINQEVTQKELDTFYIL
jgi:hypothetical protein